MPLEYDMPLYRPPVEAFSLILQPTIGCPHNKCTFCFAYKTKRFRIKKMDEIRSDIADAAGYYGPDVAKIFLADGNTIAMRTEHQLEMLALIRKAFPRVAQIASYAGARFVLKKSPKDLKRIREAGLSKLYMGVESGDPVILERICKGVKPEDTLAACLRLKEAGFILSTTVVQGLGGKERFREHASCTAELLNRIQPDELRLHTLMLEPGAPLYEQMEKGEFVPAGPKEIFEEARLLVQNLELKCRLYSHGSNYLLLQGLLPRDKQKILDTIDAATTEDGKRELRHRGILQEEDERAI
jgi:radical SAM superfamily enzyme YgiQ (UPF0313 family)